MRGYVSIIARLVYRWPKSSGSSTNYHRVKVLSISTHVIIPEETCSLTSGESIYSQPLLSSIPASGTDTDSFGPSGREPSAATHTTFYWTSQWMVQGPSLAKSHHRWNHRHDICVHNTTCSQGNVGGSRIKHKRLCDLDRLQQHPQSGFRRQHSLKCSSIYTLYISKLFQYCAQTLNCRFRGSLQANKELMTSYILYSMCYCIMYAVVGRDWFKY